MFLRGVIGVSILLCGERTNYFVVLEVHKENARYMLNPVTQWFGCCPMLPAFSAMFYLLQRLPVQNIKFCCILGIFRSKFYLPHQANELISIARPCKV